MTHPDHEPLFARATTVMATARELTAELAATCRSSLRMRELRGISVGLSEARARLRHLQVASDDDTVWMVKQALADAEWLRRTLDASAL